MDFRAVKYFEQNIAPGELSRAMNYNFSFGILPAGGYIYSAISNVVLVGGLKYPENFLFRDA